LAVNARDAISDPTTLAPAVTLAAIAPEAAKDNCVSELPTDRTARARATMAFASVLVRPKALTVKDRAIPVAARVAVLPAALAAMVRAIEDCARVLLVPTSREPSAYATFAAPLRLDPPAALASSATAPPTCTSGAIFGPCCGC